MYGTMSIAHHLKKNMLDNQVSLKVFEYLPERKCLASPSKNFKGRFPTSLLVTSHHTKETIQFNPVKQEDPLFCQDGWDGEQQIYRPAKFIKNVEYLVIHHGEN